MNPYFVAKYMFLTPPIVIILYDSDCISTPNISLITCESANTKCPHISEAIQQYYLPYLDPKISDNTENQAQIYLEVNKQIAGEIHYIFKMIKENL